VQVQLRDPNTTIRSGIGTGRPAGVLAIEGANAQATIEAMPEPLRPGEHTLVLAPSAIKTVSVVTDGGLGTGFVPDFSALPYVGWYQKETGVIFDAYMVEVAQTAINFDLADLDAVPNKTIKDAVLTYYESPASWTNGDGDQEEKTGCVEMIGRATAVWDRQDLDGLIPNELILGPRQGGGTEWAVKDYVAGWARNTRPRLGFVLRGGNEDPHGDDNASCMSHINDIKLTIRYEVPK
jgi:hypothetical protein